VREASSQAGEVIGKMPAGVNVGHDFAVEKPLLRPLPTEPFDAA
jgi:hypothetical protein